MPGLEVELEIEHRSIEQRLGIKLTHLILTWALCIKARTVRAVSQGGEENKLPVRMSKEWF
jgi:hypothetical protein